MFEAARDLYEHAPQHPRYVDGTLVKPPYTCEQLRDAMQKWTSDADGEARDRLLSLSLPERSDEQHAFDSLELQRVLELLAKFHLDPQAINATHICSSTELDIDAIRALAALPPAAAPAARAWQPFPLHVLPPRLARFLADVARTTATDPAAGVTVALPLLAAAVGATREVRARVNFRQPLSLWTVFLADSGSRKAAIFDTLCEPVFALQEQKHSSWLDHRAAYVAKMARYKKQGKESAGTAEEQKFPGATGPAYPHIVTTNCTIEALSANLAITPRGLLVPAAEMSSFFGSLGQYKKGGGGGASHDVAEYCKTYDGSSMKIDRKTQPEPIVVQRPLVSIAGAVQPSPFWRAVTDDLCESGFPARFWCALRLARHFARLRATCRTTLTGARCRSDCASAISSRASSARPRLYRWTCRQTRDACSVRMSGPRMTSPMSWIPPFALLGARGSGVRCESPHCWRSRPPSMQTRP